MFFNKMYLVALLFTFQILYIDAMIKPITEPYEPGIIARHPHTTSFVKALVVGGIVTAGCVACSQKTQNPFTKTLCAGALGIGAAGVFYLYDQYDQYTKQPSNLVDCILTDALKGLNTCYKVFNQFSTAVKNQNIKDEKNITQWLSKAKMFLSDDEEQWPLFF